MVDQASAPSETTSPQFRMQQIWPEPKTIPLSATVSESLWSDSLLPADPSLSQLVDFLTEYMVSYDVDRSFDHIRHPRLHHQVTSEHPSYEWCPLLPATTPLELQSYVEDTHLVWNGPIPEGKLADIHVIANERYVRGLAVQKDGKSHRIIVKQAPLVFDKPPSDDIIQSQDGWFVSTIPETPPSAKAVTKVQAIPVAAEAGVPAEEDQSDFEGFTDFVSGEGLSYHADDLVLLYCSLRARQFVVLGGSGGIGKSSLALAVAKFFGCTPPGERMAWLTVEPSWVSSEQLAGYYDASSRLFRPAVSGLADVLIHAHNHPEIPHLVCLDELNLARVEHYLAPLLSLKEHAEAGLRWTFYSPHQASECLNPITYPPSVPVSSNIAWMGTVNLDEASYGLTDKFLDRVTYIALRRSLFQDRPSHESKQARRASTVLLLPPTPIPLQASELAYFDDLNAITSIPLLGWRTLDAMRLSIGAVPRVSGLPVWDQAKAWDEQFAARVLSKFRGAGVEWETWRSKAPSLKDRLLHSPWGPLARSMTVLDEITELKEWDHVI